MSEKKLGFLIGNLFYAYTSYMNSYLTEMDLTLSQTRILLVLALNGGISIYELSKATNIGKSSITKSVKILEINSQTKSGRKAYVFIERNWQKEGITYLDEPTYLTHKELTFI